MLKAKYLYNMPDTHTVHRAYTELLRDENACAVVPHAAIASYTESWLLNFWRLN